MNWTPEKLIDAMKRCANPTSRCMVKDCPAAELVEHRCQDLMLTWGAEQIERDQKEIRELRENIPHWISCKKQPPTVAGKYHVLLHTPGGTLTDTARYYPGDGWFCDDWPIPSNKITAWMPFPKPVKEIKE